MHIAHLIILMRTCAHTEFYGSMNVQKTFKKLVKKKQTKTKRGGGGAKNSHQMQEFEAHCLVPGLQVVLLS